MDPTQQATTTQPGPATTRRTFLAGAAAGAAALTLPSTALAQRARRGNPFTLGVASGDPLPRGVVLWTRLAPNPIEGGGMPARGVRVEWELAADEGFRRIVDSGREEALPQFAHSVHVELEGLRPHTEYWYRFRTGLYESPVGRTITAPRRNDPVGSLRFAFASCNDWQNGYWPAFRDMAEQDLELVVHLGDYIYEYGPDPTGLRQHEGPEVESLESYRNRYGLYKGDEALQAVHARFPFVVTPDDHEVENNHANLIREEDANPNAIPFELRRAYAYRAYYEHMPLRRASLPAGPDSQLYRRLAYGDLAEFSILDTRQYRTDQPCGDGLKPREGCADSLSPEATMTGPEQERWLLRGLERSRATWNVIGQQTILAQFDFNPSPTATVFNMDQWDGYVAARNRVLGFLAHREPSNPVVLTGDIHSSWVFDLKTNFDDPGSRTVGTEFVGTSISSDFPASVIPAVTAATRANPHNKFFDGAHRGYVRCEVTQERWKTDFRAVEDIASADARAFTLASYDVEDGTPGAVRVATRS